MAGVMRAGMTPEEVRAAGIYLNGGRRRGWKRRLADLLGTPETTIATWATSSSSNARPIPGVAVVALKLLVAMYRQELLAGPDVGRAAHALAERITAITSQPELFPPTLVPVPPPQPTAIGPAVLQAEARGARRKPRRPSLPGTDTRTDALLFEVTHRRRDPRKPT